MISEWWTYRAGDFLLFSERVYWRLFELHNAAVWPAQIAALLLGAMIAALVLRPRPWSGRLIAAILAAAWTFVAWAFLWNRYATINWAARYAVPVFVGEALLLIWAGGLRDRLRFRVQDGGGQRVGLALFLYGLAAHPLVAVVAGRPLAAAEIFGLAPDPTAIATIGLLLTTTRGGGSWMLFVVPIAWCAASAATLFAMGTREAWIPLAAILVALLTRPRQRAQGAL